MERKPLNLSIPVDLARDIKIQALRDVTSVSHIAEDAFRDYLFERDPEYRRKAKPKS
jgi:hypothetical protein